MPTNVLYHHAYKTLFQEHYIQQSAVLCIKASLASIGAAVGRLCLFQNTSFHLLKVIFVARVEVSQSWQKSIDGEPPKSALLLSTTFSSASRVSRHPAHC